ncbi:MAG: hypothetical protein IJX17_04115 [Clostridia bacterium]|nr:hypothetical protein [Clostridia bacterium]
MKDTTIIGYYYANNQPTSINFYTWNDTKSSYEKYEKNIDEYTLQSTTTSKFYQTIASELVVAEGAIDYIEQGTNRVVLLRNESFGIDVARFGTGEDIYKTLEINASIDDNKNFLVDNLIRNYWFYKRYVSYLYFMDSENSNKKTYILYNEGALTDANPTNYYYINKSGQKQFVQLLSENFKDDAFTIYLYKVSSLADKVKIGTSAGDLTFSAFLSGTDKEIIAQVEKNYDSQYGNYDLKGSQMYHKQGEKYYPIFRIEDYRSQPDSFLTPTEKAQIATIYDDTNKVFKGKSARFYVKIEDQLFYLLAETESTNNNVNILYTYADLGEKDGKKQYAFTNSSRTAIFKNIDFYYVKIEENYYPVELTPHLDQSGLCRSYYYTPETMTDNIVVVNGVSYCFDYETKYLYTTGSINEKVQFLKNGPNDDDPQISFKMYTPVNDNYTIILEAEKTNIWQFSGVNINSLPSPNIGFWYNNNQYGYVGYINFRQDDLSYIKSTVVKEDFAYKDVYDPYVEGDEQVLLYQNERIYDVAEKYINIVFKDSSYNQILYQKDGEDISARTDLLLQIKDFCDGKYDLKKLLGSLITVGRFYTTLDSNIVTGVDILVPVTIPLIDKTKENKPFEITVTVRYFIDIISDTTNIDGTIYAIPIYSRNVVEYTNTSVSSGGSKITIDINEMNYTYFENEGNIYTHYFNPINSNFLKFAILDQTKYDLLINSLNYPDKLTFLFNNTNFDTKIPVLSQDKNVHSIVFDFSQTEWVSNNGESFTWELPEGDYYIIAYHEKIVQVAEGIKTSYVIRTSDNVIKVKVDDNGNIQSTIQKYQKNI